MSPNPNRSPQHGGRRVSVPSNFSLDEAQRALTRLVVGELERRRFHVVAARADQRPADAAIERELGAADRIDDHAGGIRRIPYLELELDTERSAAECSALHADIGKLAVAEPGHVIARPDVDVLVRQRYIELAVDGARLGNLLRGQPLAFEHVEKIGIPAKVQLIGAVKTHAALA